VAKIENKMDLISTIFMFFFNLKSQKDAGCFGFLMQDEAMLKVN